MHKARLSRIRSKFAMATLIAEVILAFIATACMKNYGAFSLDDQVGQDFRSGNIRPEFEYYYSGRDTMPYAIIGIDPSYTVPSKHWISIEPRPDRLRKMSGNIYGKDQYYPYGAYILDPQGKVIGIWYSSLTDHAVKIDPDRYTVHVLFRNPESTDGGPHPTSIRP